MTTLCRIALVGDHDPAITAHRAIPMALQLVGNALGCDVDPEWVGTEELASSERVQGFHALWCVPGSPYRSMDGALRAIRFAREAKRPFLGTCGGFQHAVIEYARSVLGWADAEHAETAPDAPRAVISPLACSLVEVSERLALRAGSRVATAYGALQAFEGYHCRYGLNPAFQAALTQGPLRATAHDEAGAVRAVELGEHPFFVATLFQPERAALRGQVPALAAALVRVAQHVRL